MAWRSIRETCVIGLLFFVVCLGLGFSGLERYDPRSVPGLRDTQSYAAMVKRASVRFSTAATIASSLLVAQISAIVAPVLIVACSIYFVDLLGEGRSQALSELPEDLPAAF